MAGVTNLQGVVNSAGAYYTGARALKLPPELTVTQIADTDSPGYVGPNGSVRGVLALSFTAASKASTYLRDDGASGVKLGRFDLDTTSGGCAALKVENSDGSAYNLHVDDDICRVGSSILQVGGAAGASLGPLALDFPIQGSAPAAPASGFRRAYAIGNVLSVKEHDATVRRVDCWRPRFVTFADTPVTALDGDMIFADTTDGGISIVVPNAAGAGAKIYRAGGSTAITVTASSGTIHGLSSTTVGSSGAETRGDGTNVWT